MSGICGGTQINCMSSGAICVWCAGPVTDEEMEKGEQERKKQKWKQDNNNYIMLTVSYNCLSTVQWGALR